MTGLFITAFLADERLKSVEEVPWVFPDLFGFHFPELFNCFPALFRGQIYVFLLKFEVFFSFVFLRTSIISRQFLLSNGFFPCHVRDIVFSFSPSWCMMINYVIHQSVLVIDSIVDFSEYITHMPGSV